jgi:phosphoglycolate phosphatase
MAASWRGRPIDAVLFDLDGTLIDTVGDIARSLNLATAEQGWPALAQEAVRTMIGRGSPRLIERAARALSQPLDPELHARLLQRFLIHYAELELNGTLQAEPYPGARETLEAVRAHGLRTAVVTNKQQHLSEGLLAHLGLAASIELVVGGDRCERRKPDPEPLLFACRHLQVPPERTLMVGDSINDVEAARGARIPIVCVPYGYNEGNDPRTLPCDAFIESLTDLPALLRL